MVQSDLEALLDMGFEKDRAELAVKKTGGLQGALEWLEVNQDKPMEQILSEQSHGRAAGDDAGDDEDDPTIEPAPLKPGEVAQSLVCNECGKRFRSQDQASYHASKTEHMDFSESTEEIKPLTEEEKQARLEEMRARLKEKKARQAVTDQVDAKRNEQIRMKSTKDRQDLKEEIQRKEQIKAAQQKRQDKLDDIEAKKRIQAKIQADKDARARKAAEAKAVREGQPMPAEAEPAAGPSAVAAKPARNTNEARLRIQTPSGTFQKTFSADATLFEVAQACAQENGAQVGSFTSTFPRKVFEGAVDFGMTLKEAGLTPNASLIAK